MPRTAAVTLPSHSAMVRRLCRLFRQTSAQDLAVGLGWYAQAQTFCATLDPRDPQRAAGVFAALSPRCQVTTNMAWAETVLSAADNGARRAPEVHTRTMRAQAWRIANGAAPLAVLNGPKVRAFYRNITGDPYAVTVDVWAAFAATGSKDDRTVSTPGRYARVAAAYTAAAARLSHTTGTLITPRDLQAAIWTHVRPTRTNARETALLTIQPTNAAA